MQPADIVHDAQIEAEMREMLERHGEVIFDMLMFVVLKFVELHRRVIQAIAPGRPEHEAAAARLLVVPEEAWRLLREVNLRRRRV
jgi:hypothetical protein